MTDTVAVLIGTGSIGVAVARRVAVGRTLLLADHNQAQLAVVADQLQAEGYDIETRTCDVSDRASVAALARFASSLGDIVRVIHAAGVSPTQAPPERIVQVDLFGTAYVLDAFAGVMAEGGAGIVVASQAGHMGPRLSEELEQKLAHAPIEELEALPELAAGAIDGSGHAYIIAKRANALRVRAAALAWGERGARVNCISPGIISSPLARDEMTGPNAAGYARMIEVSAARRMGTPSDVAELAALLLDDRGSFITGADFLIDGGVIAAMRGAAL
jgi:NAD(P)-dependent dehydrogenase (short-subunit alcohol dehydrogenase family)